MCITAFSDKMIIPFVQKDGFSKTSAKNITVSHGLCFSFFKAFKRGRGLFSAQPFKEGQRLQLFGAKRLQAETKGCVCCLPSYSLPITGKKIFFYQKCAFVAGADIDRANRFFRRSAARAGESCHSKTKLSGEERTGTLRHLGATLRTDCSESGKNRLFYGQKTVFHAVCIGNKSAIVSHRRTWNGAKNGGKQSTCTGFGESYFLPCSRKSL